MAAQNQYLSDEEFAVLRKMYDETLYPNLGEPLAFGMDERSFGYGGTSQKYYFIQLFLFVLVVLSALVFCLSMLLPTTHVLMTVVSGVVLFLSVLGVANIAINPDSVRAQQSDVMLKFASKLLEAMQNGINEDSAKQICHLLLRYTSVAGVGITDREQILGYDGIEMPIDVCSGPINMDSAKETLKDGLMRVLTRREDVDLPMEVKGVKAAIIVPLTLGDDVVGTCLFFYKNARKISETQISIAEGFGHLLSTELAAVNMEEQRQLATSMKLKALQSQINPHFLFNTINTIASLTRTDPERARVLLREFAVFYRRVLEDNQDRIPLSREIEQTVRYFTFEIARFGEDRLCLNTKIDPAVQEFMVPPFLVQPFVENAVRHALPQEGRLTINITGTMKDDYVILKVADDGLGMDKKARENILHPDKSMGMGIAVSNVHDRLINAFGYDASLDVQSRLGKGTVITLKFRPLKA